MKRFVVTFISIMHLFLSGCFATPELAAVPPDAVVLAFGDSLTAGTGAAPETSYPAVLSRLIGRAVVNAGIPGEVTSTGLARLAETLDREKPALVLLCLGGNDFLRRMDDANAEKNLRAMVAMIRGRGIGVVLIGVPRLGFGLEVPKWYRAVAKDASIPYEGEILKRVLSDSSLKSDPIHPNAAGYHQVAESLSVLLKKSGALP